MRGDKYIYDLRKRYKLKPQCIFVNDYECEDWVTDVENQGAYPTVVTHGDMIPTLDFRFAIGCNVSASSASEARARALFDRIKVFKPALLVSAHIDGKTARTRDREPWFGVYKEEEKKDA